MTERGSSRPGLTGPHLSCDLLSCAVVYTDGGDLVSAAERPEGSSKVIFA